MENIFTGWADSLQQPFAYTQQTCRNNPEETFQNGWILVAYSYSPILVHVHDVISMEQERQSLNWWIDVSSASTRRRCESSCTSSVTTSAPSSTAQTWLSSSLRSRAVRPSAAAASGPVQASPCPPLLTSASSTSLRSSPSTSILLTSAN